MTAFRFPSLLALLLALVALPLAGCDSSDDDDDGGGPAGCSTASGSFTAQAGGSAFDAVCIQADFDSGVFFIVGIVNVGQTGTSEQKQININVPGASTGQRSINPLGGVIATYVEGGDPSSLETFVATSGTLNITALSASGASGTFSFEGIESASGNTISVTNGSFDVTF